jgi:hypothetical protein
MTTSGPFRAQSLPVRPSLDSLRKQAKKLARDVAAGDADAIARARSHLPNVDAPLSQRNAQLVIAREYGYTGWTELTAEVSKRLGNSLEWAAAEAARVIHDNDVERLEELLAQHPALLSWKGHEDPKGLLNMATSAYGDAGDPQREQSFTRGACAELLLDAGAIVDPDVPEGLLRSRARGLLQLFHRKNLLPRTLKFLAALGDIEAVRGALEGYAFDLATVNDAFLCACRFDHEPIATLLLERCISLDPELRTHVDRSADRLSFIASSKKANFEQVAAYGLWKVFVMEQIRQAAHDRDLTAFVRRLEDEAWLLGDAWVDFQGGLIEMLAFQREPENFIAAFLDLNPAILLRPAPPPSRAIDWAFMYANTHLLPLLTRIWPVPDALPFAAGTGNLARVKQWFDDDGVLRNPENQYPYNDPDARGHLRWDIPTAQQVLDVALAFAVINRHFDVADFLLERGADIDNKWNSHEPASMLHSLIFLPNPYPAMQYLIDRGIDMTIRDYRWNSNAANWARYGNGDEKMAQWLEAAERQPKLPR